MRFIKIVLLAFCVLQFCSVNAQQPTIQVLESGKKISIRGLSVVNDNIIWASGSRGSVARSTNGGATFTWMTVPGYEKSDFRDIEAFDENTAIIMGITEPAVLLKTTDGGKNWRKIFEDTTKGAFFDAMDFSHDKYGFVIGDPINHALFIAETLNQGESWELISPGRGSAFYQAKEGEAFFASSGTNIKMLSFGYNHFLMASGGKVSRLWYGNRQDSIPIMQGKESTGANSIAVFNNKKAVIVGGDFTRDTIPTNNCVFFDLNLPTQVTFKIPTTPPHGYRSCVIYLTKNNLLTCGTSGVDISKDGGNNWTLISKESFHVCQKARKGKAVFLAGGNGRIAKLVL
ncbi:MAG: oxidoreductase [Bacteroidota bacterium]